MFTWTCIFLPAGEAFSDYTKQFKFFLFFFLALNCESNAPFVAITDELLIIIRKAYTHMTLAHLVPSFFSSPLTRYCLLFNFSPCSANMP